MNLLEIFYFMIGLFYKKNTVVLRLPGPLKIVVKEIHYQFKLADYSNDGKTSVTASNDSDICNEIIVAESPKIAPGNNSLSVHRRSAECGMEVMDWCLLFMIVWTIIVGLAKLLRPKKEDRPLAMKIEQEEDNDVFFDFQPELQHSEDEFFEFQEFPDLTNDEKVCLDIDEEKDVFHDWFLNFQFDPAEVFPDLEPEKAANLNLETHKNNEFSSLESDEMNGFSDLPFYEEEFPDLLSDEEEKFLYSEFIEEGFPDLPSNEEGFSHVFSNEEGYPKFLSDEEEIFLYFKAKEEIYPDFPSDEESKVERCPAHHREMLDLPSDEEAFIYSKIEKKDLPSREEIPDLPSDVEEMRLYLKAYEERFTDSPSDEDERLSYLEFKVGSSDLPSNRKRLFNPRSDTPSESKEKGFPVRYPSTSCAPSCVPVKRKNSPICSPTKKYRDRSKN